MEVLLPSCVLANFEEFAELFVVGVWNQLSINLVSFRTPNITHEHTGLVLLSPYQINSMEERALYLHCCFGEVVGDLVDFDCDRFAPVLFDILA